MSKPYLIVTLGPTGSGKSLLIEHTISYLGLNPTYTKILIDDLVENNPKYKKKVLSIIHEVFKECQKEGKFCQDIKCTKCDTSSYYQNPTKNLLDKFQTAYYTTRKEANCVIGSTLNCDDQNDLILKNAIKNNDNIIFETTGGYIPSWLISSPYITSKYQILFSYSIVSFNELIRRNTGRTIKSIDDFLVNRSNPAPRLPDIEYNSFRSRVITIKNTLLRLYNKCILSYEEKLCGKERIDRLLIFNNSGSSMTIAIDSENDKLSDAEFVRNINILFGLSRNRRRSRKKAKSVRRRSSLS